MRNSTQMRYPLEPAEAPISAAALKVWGWFIGTFAVVGLVIWGMTLVEQRRVVMQTPLNPPVASTEQVPNP
jgi:hypothetical protein